MTLEEQVSEAKSLIKPLIDKVKELEEKLKQAESDKADVNKGYDELAFVNEKNLKRFNEIESQLKDEINNKNAALSKAEKEIEELKKTEEALRDLLKKTTERSVYFEEECEKLRAEEKPAEEKPKKRSSYKNYVFGKADAKTCEQFKNFLEHFLPEEYGYCNFMPTVAAVQSGISVEACKFFTETLLKTTFEDDPLVTLIKNRYYSNFSRAKIIEYLFTEA